MPGGGEPGRARLVLEVAGLFAIVAIGLAVLAGIPQLIPIALLVGALALARELWLRRGLRGFEYGRRLGTRHAVWGDRVPITITLWNRSWLPAAWLTAQDRLSDEADIRGAAEDGAALDLAEGDRNGRRWLRNAWTLWPFEKVERRFVLHADRRGRILFGPVELTASDLFAGQAGEGQLLQHEELTIAPRVLPVQSATPRARWSAQQRAVAGMPEDPAHFAGVRPYQRGDTPRRIHWRATARTGAPRSKRFEASRERELLLVVDIQTVPGPAIGGGYEPELVEALCVVAASLARDAITTGARCGLASAAFSYRPRSEVRVHPAAGPTQLLALTDALARLSPYASGPLSGLLAGLPRWVETHTQLVLLTARDPAESLPVLRRLRATGFDLRVVAVGPAASAIVARATAAGFPAVSATLDPDWRTAPALSIAG
ncbi:MAG: DUF58 domain-containing protein [Chloroflexota bacterium]